MLTVAATHLLPSTTSHAVPEISSSSCTHGMTGRLYAAIAGTDRLQTGYTATT